MIHLENIWVVFNPKTALETTVLQGIDLKIEAGRFVVIIGGNGAGKSTLLRTISGEVIPKRGAVWIEDKNILKHSSSERAKYVSRVFQDPMLGTCPALSVEENMALASERGKSRKLIPALDATLRANFYQELKKLGVGLESKLKKPVASLSGGERQILSLVMATLEPSKILLLDEHTAALDPKRAREVMLLTDRIVRDHKQTTLMITHSLEQALHYGDELLVLEQGKIKHRLTQAQRQRLSSTELLQLFEQES